ncbi:MAG: ComEC/Rec2 family competence protein [Bdellovibrionales bacterium]|nr:ComEC/Rec2 family competence protein [Bdellovibrionales bacterium]
MLRRVLRILARIERGAPLALNGTVFFFGQCLMLSESSVLFFLVVSAMLFSFFVGKSVALWRIALPLSIGCLSIVLLRGGSPHLEHRQKDLSLLVSLEQGLRYRQPGGVEATAKVLHVIQSDRTSEQLLGKQILIRAKDLPWRNSGTWQEGDVVFVRGDFIPLHGDALSLSYEGSLVRKGIVGRFRTRFASRAVAKKQNVFGNIRRTIISRVRTLLGNTEGTGLFLSLLVGKRDTLRKSTDEAFRTTGLSHVLVVSGFHVSMVFLFFLWLFRVFRSYAYTYLGVLPPSSFEMWGALFISFCFVGLCGFEPSSLRACVALALFCVARMLGGRALSWGAWTSSLVILCCFWPACILDLGIQYTYAALCAILLVQGRDPLEVRLSETKREKLKKYFQISTGATIATGLVSLFHFGTFPLLGFILNPLLAPLFVLIGTKLGYLALGLHVVGIDSQGVGLGVCRDLLSWIKELVLYVSRIY